MKQLLLLFVAILFSSIQLLAQQTPRIEFNLKTEAEIVILAYYYGDKQYVKDSLAAKSKGKFVYESDETLKGGMYSLVVPEKSSFDFFVSKNEQRFSVTGTPGVDFAKTAKFTNSPDNTLFYTYLNYLGKQRAATKQYTDKLQELLKVEDAKQDKKQIKELREILNGFTKKVVAYQNDIITKHPTTFTAKFIGLAQDVSVPDNPNPEDKGFPYRYYKGHYFDKIDLGDNRIIRTPMLHRKIMQYLDKVVLQHPDSLVKEIDIILLKSSEDLFNYLMVKLINKYAKSEIVGMDAVYVHLALKYLDKGRGGSISEEDVKKIVKNAKKLEPLLIGKVAPNFSAQLISNPEKFVSLHGVDATYTALIFWAPDCGHCKKSMPKAVEFYNEYRSKGVKIFSVCTKFGEKSNTCPPFVEEKEIGDLINVFDTTPRHSRYFTVTYDIKSTPVIYLLDKDKKIISKRIGVEQLGEVIDNDIKRLEYLKNNPVDK